MSKMSHNRMTVTQHIGGVDAIINTEPGEIYIDIPANSPRYIHVREGDRITEGDVRSQTREELESPTLKKWRIESISEDTVAGVNTETGELNEWDREWLVERLSIGEYSVDLWGFGRVSVAETGMWEHGDTDDQVDAEPMVVVTIYANNGQRFTQRYTADHPDDWESLTIAERDPRIDTFGEELRERFDDAVATALKTEKRYS